MKKGLTLLLFLVTLPVKVNVKELPGTAPTTFSGAVGSLTFDVNLDKSVTKENEPVNLKFKIVMQ